VPLQLAPEGDRISPPRDFDGVTALQLEVLVAEDHPVNREVLAALLESMGHRALFVPNGDDAVAAVQRQRFDLVLMDLHMPGLDGIEATRQIRNLADRAAATVPIVALTADAFTDTRERCLIAGMNSFLSKPVSREKLGALMRQLFGSGAGIEPEVLGHAASARPELNDPDAVPLIDSAAVARTLQVLTAQQYASMLAMYLDQAPATVDRLRKAVRDAQPQELGVHAHASRGAALNLGLSALAATAEVLQNGAAHLPAHEVARLVQRFDDLLTSTRVAAEQAGLLNSAVGVR
jgi:CheY-like chemotaxis protein